MSVAGADVSVNGRSVGTSPLTEDVYITPGSANVVARRDGYIMAQQAVEVPKGEAHDVSLELLPSGAQPEARSRVPGIVLGSAAGAALAVGIGLLVDAGAKGSTSRDLNSAILNEHHSCVTGASNYDTRCKELNDTALSGEANHRIGVGFLVGAGVAAAGAAAYFLWPVKKSDTPSSHALRVVPAVSTRDAGFILSGAF